MASERLSMNVVWRKFIHELGSQSWWMTWGGSWGILVVCMDSPVNRSRRLLSNMNLLFIYEVSTPPPPGHLAASCNGDIFHSQYMTSVRMQPLVTLSFWFRSLPLPHHWEGKTVLFPFIWLNDKVYKFFYLRFMRRQMLRNFYDGMAMQEVANLRQKLHEVSQDWIQNFYFSKLIF